MSSHHHYHAEQPAETFSVYKAPSRSSGRRSADLSPSAQFHQQHHTHQPQELQLQQQQQQRQQHYGGAGQANGHYKEVVVAPSAPPAPHHQPPHHHQQPQQQEESTEVVVTSSIPIKAKAKYSMSTAGTNTNDTMETAGHEKFRTGRATQMELVSATQQATEEDRGLKDHFVTMQNFRPGMAVRRFPDYDWTDYDGPDASKGVLLSQDKTVRGWAVVRWCDGEIDHYRLDDEGYYPLVYI